MATQNEIREQITNQIIQSLERGTTPWRRPWSSDPCAGAPKNAVSRRGYTGINPLVLQLAAESHGFTSRYWATYRQWEEKGFQVMKRPEHVRRGTWGTNIVFCKQFTKRTDENTEEEDNKTFLTLRTFTVFNADQVTGGDIERFRVGSTPIVASEIEGRFQEAERVVAATGAEIRFGGSRAYCSLDQDYIQMPPKSQFAVPDFWDTLFHEMTHWTEHPSRLNWDRKIPEHTYALGEVIAELGSCFLAGELGLPLNETLENHAAYLKDWLQQMKADSRWIFRATAQASRAADFILSFSRVEEPEQVLA